MKNEDPKLYRIRWAAARNFDKFFGFLVSAAYQLPEPICEFRIRCLDNVTYLSVLIMTTHLLIGAVENQLQW